MLLSRIFSQHSKRRAHWRPIRETGKGTSVLSHVKRFTVLLSEDRNVRHAAPRCNFTCAVASSMHDARNLAAMSPSSVKLNACAPVTISIIAFPPTSSVSFACSSNFLLRFLIFAFQEIASNIDISL